GRILGEGLLLAILLTMPFVAVVLSVAPILSALGYEHALAEGIAQFLGAIVWGAPGMLCFGALRSYLAAVSRPRAVMVVLLAGLPATAALNWILIFGHLGFPALGIAGSGYASALVNVAMAAGGAASVVVGRGALRRPSAHGMIEMLHLGLPIA